MRPRQWVKNLLVLTAPLAAGRLFEPAVIKGTALAFVAFCLVSAAVYLVNDVRDVEEDRQHPTKRFRPIAAGELSVALAVAVAFLLGAGGLYLGWAAGALLPAVAYLGGTLLYSAVLKTLSLVDVFALGALYTVRVVAGGEASGHPVSEWLLAFCGFLFVSLACMKRVAELRAHSTDAPDANRRAYANDDARFLEMLGIGSSVASSVVLALYAKLQAPETGSTGRVVLLWSVSPVMLFWQMRLWLSTFRGYMLEDPLAYAANDWVTRLAGLLVVVLFLLSAA